MSKPTKPATAASVARVAFPTWKGRRASFDTSGRVHTYNMAWDGGSKNEYRAVDLATGKVATMPPSSSTPAEFGGTAGFHTIVVPAGFAVVCHSICCGQDTGCTVYLSAAPALDGASVPELC